MSLGITCILSQRIEQQVGMSLNCIKDAELSVDYTSELHIILPDTEEFNSLDLTKSRKEELEKAEK